MMNFSFIYEHNLSPFLFHIGDFGIRWYSVMYMLGFAFTYWFYAYVLLPQGELKLEKKDIPDIILYAFIGLLIGARTVYMLFYNLPALLENPLTYVQVWNGGLSFHGGLIGVIVALSIFIKYKHLPLLRTADRLILPVPIALFLGRIGNFINGELYGKPVDPDTVPFCVLFPDGGESCRVPSQLIEAAGEGLILFLILLLFFYRTPKWARASAENRRPKNGSVFALFLLLYGIVRFAIEYLREPDSQLGLIWNSFSMGQLLSLPMIAIGLTLFLYSMHHKNI